MLHFRPRLALTVKAMEVVLVPLLGPTDCSLLCLAGYSTGAISWMEQQTARTVKIHLFNVRTDSMKNSCFFICFVHSKRITSALCFHPLPLSLPLFVFCFMSHLAYLTTDKFVFTVLGNEIIDVENSGLPAENSCTCWDKPLLSVLYYPQKFLPMQHV